MKQNQCQRIFEISIFCRFGCVGNHLRVSEYYAIKKNRIQGRKRQMLATIDLASDVRHMHIFVQKWRNPVIFVCNNFQDSGLKNRLFKFINGKHTYSEHRNRL